MAQPPSPRDPGPLVLLVGHCTADARSLAGAVRDAAPDARVEAVGNGRDYEERLPGAALVLINRRPDGWFGNASGLDLVSLAVDRGVRAMLVSNLSEAQQEAEKRGALPGFGKAEGGSDRVRSLLQAAIK
jgi:hypothetical protein